MSKAKIVFYLILLGVVSLCSYGFYYAFSAEPGDSPEGEYSFEVYKGATLSEIAKQLEEEDVINNADAFIILSKLDSMIALQEGKYIITDLPASPSDILDQINDNSRVIKTQHEEADKRPIIKGVLFKEGYTLDKMIEILDEKGVIEADKLEDYAMNPDNFDRGKYEFLPEPLDCTYGNIKTCVKYYPEGYLYPDTYDFYKNSTPEEIYDKLLGNFDTKVWSKVKDQVKNEDLNFEKAVILASVLEKETGRTKGITEANKELLAKERRLMAQVFINRVDIGLQWQSDVTAEYGHGRKLCQQTFEVKNCIYLNDPLTNTKYNTYKVKGYPIGPVTNPQYENIYAALNPIDNDYLYFLSDVTGKKYFYETENEFYSGIAKIKKINEELNSQD